MRGVNCGSGQRKFDPVYWINLDIDAKVHAGGGPDVLGDMFRMPIRNESMDYVVAHHTFEHIDIHQRDGFIDEARRVLRPSGSLLIFLPDLRILAQRWLLHQLDDDLYMFNVYGAYQGNEWSRHKWGYTSETLRRYLSKWEWRALIPFNWRPIEGADIARDWYIIGMEAVI